MKSFLYHLQINIDYSNASFYKNLLLFLGWSVIFEAKDIIGLTSGKGGDLWFLKSLKKGQTDYDKVGVNHISVRVEDAENVNKTAAYLKKQKIKMLFGTPKHRPEFVSKNDETYYQIMFESPDRILFEIVYIGPKK